MQKKQLLLEVLGILKVFNYVSGHHTLLAIGLGMLLHILALHSTPTRTLTLPTRTAAIL